MPPSLLVQAIFNVAVFCLFLSADASLHLKSSTGIPKSVQWYGDQRGAGGTDAFYDLIYDDPICSGIFKSYAIYNFVYLGPLLSSFSTDRADQCLTECFTHQQCKSINFYRAKAFALGGFCELMAGTQKDRPSWMRHYSGAIYYENISCGDNKNDYTEEDYTEKSYNGDRLREFKPSKSDPSTKEKGFMDSIIKTLSDYIKRRA